jgi:hypothetical protein
MTRGNWFRIRTTTVAHIPAGLECWTAASGGTKMLIRGQAASAKADIKDAKDAKPDRVKSLLSLYGDAPTGEIRLEEFEKFSIDRLMGTCRPCLIATHHRMRRSDAPRWPRAAVPTGGGVPVRHLSPL